MSNGFERFTYTAHTEARLTERGVSKAELEAALETATTVYPSRGAFVAEVTIPGKDRLVLKVVFSLPHPQRPHVITIHHVLRKRTRL